MSTRHTDVRSLFCIHCVRTGAVSRATAAICIGLFERRQESGYYDFLSLEEWQTAPWLPQAAALVGGSARSPKLKVPKLIGDVGDGGGWTEGKLGTEL